MQVFGVSNIYEACVNMLGLQGCFDDERDGLLAKTPVQGVTEGISDLDCQSKQPTGEKKERRKRERERELSSLGGHLTQHSDIHGQAVAFRICWCTTDDQQRKKPKLNYFIESSR